MRKHLSFSLLIILLAAACSHALERFTFTEPHMGTTARIVLYAPNEATAKKAATAAFARIAELNLVMSDYNPNSELMRLCAKAGGDPVAISTDLYDVLEKSLAFAKLTDGALDITISPVVRLWRKAKRTRVLPSSDEIKQALALVDYRNIKLDSQRRTAQLLVMGMLLDLGSIGKGYAADAALAVLRKQGLPRALVALGGDIAVGDAPPNTKGWKVGVAPLKNPGADPTHYLLLTNAGVSTAGDAEQYVEIAGKRYSHIIDPKTGIGQVGRRSVTVIAPNATTSDALDTAVCVMGLDRGLKLIESLEGVAALCLFEVDNQVITKQSARFAKYNESR